MIVFVLGGPGAGKGTVCARLAAELGLVHISVGDLLRARLDASHFATGGLVPSAVATQLLREEAARWPGRGLLIDGFPRSAENVRDWGATGPAMCLHLRCSDAVLCERMAARARPGETPAVAAERVRVHRALSERCAEAMGCPLFEIDAEAPAEAVCRAALAVLGPAVAATAFKPA